MNQTPTAVHPKPGSELASALHIEDTELLETARTPTSSIHPDLLVVAPVIAARAETPGPVEPTVPLEIAEALNIATVPDPVITDKSAEHESSARGAPQTPSQPDEPTDQAGIEKDFTEQSNGGYPLLGSMVAPGERRQLTWSATETYTGAAIPTAVLVVNGSQPGPTLCLTAAVHGDELNGIETIRRVIHGINPNKLSGTLIGVPIVNLEAFQRHSRYLSDRRDLNRFFPGNPTGSSASRIAHSFFTNVVRHCDALIDLHTGSFHRTNLPQLRADLNVAAVVELTQGFGATVTLHNEGGSGTLRRAAVNAGIPAVTLEAGAPLQVQDGDVKHAVKSIHTLLDKKGMYDKRSIWGNPEPVYYTSRWVRADSGGVLFGQVKLGKRVKAGDILGTVTDPISNESTSIVSPFRGRILGMALDQFVMPGFATFHIGIETAVEEAVEDTDTLELEHAVAVYEPERGENE